MASTSTDREPEPAPEPPEADVEAFLDLLEFCSRKSEPYAVVPLWKLLRHSARGRIPKKKLRQLEKAHEPTPTVVAGRIQLSVPNEVVENLQGPEDQRDLFLLFQFPRETLEKFRRNRQIKESGLVLPRGSVV